MRSGVDLARLADQLRRHLAQNEPALAVTVRDGGRLLTVLPPEHPVIPAPQRGLKQSRRERPEGAAFELYVALADAGASASDQRILPPVQPSAQLVLRAGRSEQMWTLRAAGGGLVSVRLRRGPKLADGDARRLLQIVQEAASSGAGAP